MDRETVDEIKRHVSVVTEGLRGEMRILAEGQAAANEKLDRIETRLDRHDGTLDRIEVRLDGVESRVAGVETRVQDVEIRMREFEARTVQELSELKAMIRLSFGQLDQRLTSLESDVQSLRERLDRLEGRRPA